MPLVKAFQSDMLMAMPWLGLAYSLRRFERCWDDVMGARGSRAGELFWRSMGKRKRNRPSREPPSQKSIIQPKTFHSMFLKWLGLFLSVLVTASALDLKS